MQLETRPPAVVTRNDDLPERVPCARQQLKRRAQRVTCGLLHAHVVPQRRLGLTLYAVSLDLLADW